MRVRLVVGVALLLVGAAWIGQGVGLIGGSFMTGQAVWAVFGGIAILAGVSLLRRPGRSVKGEGDQEGQKFDDE